MEFACDYVYVPPLVVPKDNQQVFKRSALLPPVNWTRPLSAPPPPPVEVKVSKKPEKSRAKERAVSTSIFYDNADVGEKSKQITPTRKTALLPPHLRPAAGSRSPSPSERHLYDNEDDSESSRYADSSPSAPEGAGLDGNSPGFAILTPPPASTGDNNSLPGNPNVILVSLGKLLSEKVEHTQEKLRSCTQCGSVLEPIYDNVMNSCYFCKPPEQRGTPSTGLQHGLFLLNPADKLLSASQPLLIFCIDISASMSITSQVLAGEECIHRSRLEFVQEAVLLCVNKLRKQQSDTPVGLITFNYEVTVHGYGDFPSHVLSGDDLMDSEHLKAAASLFTTPPPLSYTKNFLEQQVTGLSAVGTTALGPAALVAITMASRHPGSKVIICTDGKANTTLGNLEVDDNDARALLSATIFYQELGEDAANQGVTVSVLSIEGTECRLDELGRLADRTGGKVVITNPRMLQSEFEQIIENTTIATKCTVTLILPKPMRMRGEKEAAHKALRNVGNVHPEEEITFQFMASETEASTVSVQLQLRYTQKNGQMMLRVFTMTRRVTTERSVVLSSLSLPIIQLNSSQASAALAVRGRFLDARRESEQQKKLIEKVIEHNRSAEDRQTYKEWVSTMEPIYNNIHNFTRAKSVVSDSQSLTDAGAALLYTMKQSNRKTVMIKNDQNLRFLKQSKY
ncbi:circularly permutated Ras protein 1 isoform X4 [Syngnathus typhle]|uniref:circularly permutated Ras protein 1 isoform X4 n=1 Tax=Syngnathus typhle TaxID=161592 RepID=UPI002A6B2D28|nr:circularly permutated Ras protein 1 isoform X4 [Syngnathus typhle]